MTHNIKTYETVHEFLEECAKPSHPSWDGHETPHSREKGNAGWRGTDTYEEAVNLALNGWEAGLAKISDKLVKINKKVYGKVISKGVAGSNPDVARFIAGLPDCMNTRVYSDAAKKPCLDIMYNGSVSCNVNAECIMNYGTAVASIIDDLENSGYSIQLSICNLTQSGHITGNILHIKNHGEYMDIGKLIFFIAHPAQHRRLSFAHWEANENYNFLSFGYGTPCDLPESFKGDLYFGKNFSLSKCDTIENAIKFAKESIIKQMPELLDSFERAA